MNALTLSLIGLEDDDVANFRRVFGKLRSSLEADWRLTDDLQATLTIVDVDSIAGHMAWLKTVGAGLRAAVYTDAEYSREADWSLAKPLTAEDLSQVLNAIGVEVGAPPRATPAPPLHAAGDATTGHPPAAPAAAVVSEAAHRPVSPVAPAVVEPPVTAEPVAPVAAVPVVPIAPPAPVPTPVVTTLAEALRAQTLRRPVKFTAGDATWVIDPERDTYYGGAKLKALQATLKQRLDALEPASIEVLEKARRTAPQPLARLRWFAGLLVSPGHLRDGLDPHVRYRLTRWPQIEREFPRHFRIATAMMKGPGTVAEIAMASGAPDAEVADFINAGDAIGIVTSALAAAAEEATQGGVMSRLRLPFGR